MLQLYHHFIMMSDVTSVSKEGVPMDSNGAEATIAEYSNTPINAVREARNVCGLLLQW